MSQAGAAARSSVGVQVAVGGAQVAVGTYFAEALDAAEICRRARTRSDQAVELGVAEDTEGRLPQRRRLFRAECLEC